MHFLPPDVTRSNCASAKLYKLSCMVLHSQNGSIKTSLINVMREWGEETRKNCRTVILYTNMFIHTWEMRGYPFDLDWPGCCLSHIVPIVVRLWVKNLMTWLWSLSQLHLINKQNIIFFKTETPYDRSYNPFISRKQCIWNEKWPKSEKRLP